MRAPTQLPPDVSILVIYLVFNFGQNPLFSLLNKMVILQRLKNYQI